MFDLNGSTRSLNFIYDDAGSPYGFVYDTGTTKNVYYYVKNLQGDVTKILRASGTVFCTYTYDAWGKVISIKDGNGNTVTDTPNSASLAAINPIRYRSYYYDNDTGFYYLQSRFYDPENGRFINMDNIGVGSLTEAYNSFSYCANDPVNNTDPDGHLFFELFVAVAAVVTIICNLVCAVVNYDNNSKQEAKRSTKNTHENEQNKMKKGKYGREYQYGYFQGYYNACETIAVHNAKVSLGIESTLCDTMKDFQLSIAMPLNGIIGSDLVGIGKVLTIEGISYTRVGLSDTDKEGVYIISYWNEGAPWGGIYTVCTEYDGEQYTTYNYYTKDYNNAGRATNISPLDYAGNRYVCGYYLGKRNG